MQEAERQKAAKTKKVQEHINRTREQNARRKLDKVCLLTAGVSAYLLTVFCYGRSKIENGMQGNQVAVGKTRNRLRRMAKRMRTDPLPPRLEFEVSFVAEVQEGGADAAHLQKETQLLLRIPKLQLVQQVLLQPRQRADRHYACLNLPVRPALFEPCYQSSHMYLFLIRTTQTITLNLANHSNLLQTAVICREPLLVGEITLLGL